MSSISLIIGDDSARGELSFHCIFSEATLGIDFLIVVDILIGHGSKILLVDGLVVVLINQGIIHCSILLGLLPGVPSLRGCCGSWIFLLGFGFLSSSHFRRAGFGGGGFWFDSFIHVLVVRVLVVVSVTFSLPVRVVFILVGVLGLGGVGDGGVAVGAVVLAVLQGCPRVRHDQELLDVTLKDLLIQDPGAKDDDAVDVDDGVLAPVQELGDFLLTVQNQGDIFLLHAQSHPVPLAIC